MKAKAKIYANQLRINGTARDYIRQVENSRQIPVNETREPKEPESQQILESFRDLDTPSEDLDIGITGPNLSRQLDNDLLEYRILPYFFSDAARSKGEGIRDGDSVSLLGDDRCFEVVIIQYESEKVRIRYGEDGNEFVVPWRLIKPWRE